MAQTARLTPNPVINGIAPAHLPAVPTTGSQSPSKAKGLQLGTTKQSQSKSATSSLAAELENEAAAEARGDGAWNDGGDLIDVNADAGDWSKMPKVMLPPRETH